MIQIGDSVPQQRRTFDHLLVQARLAIGAAASIVVIGGRPAGTPFQLEIVGEGGVLALEGGAMRGFQAGGLVLSIDGKPDEPGGLAPDLPEGAVNVAAIYATLRDDIAQGTRTVTGFQHAVKLARLIEAVVASAQQGTRVPAAGWPEE